jgi:hypothetical protein
MVPLLYSASQVILVNLWLVDWIFWKRSGGRVLTAQVAREFKHHRMTFAEVLWFMFFFLAIAMSLVSAIGGTSKLTMQHVKH